MNDKNIRIIGAILASIFVVLVIWILNSDSRYEREIQTFCREVAEQYHLEYPLSNQRDYYDRCMRMYIPQYETKNRE